MLKASHTLAALPKLENGIRPLLDVNCPRVRVPAWD